MLGYRRQKAGEYDGGKVRNLYYMKFLNLFYFPAHLLQIEAEANSRDNMSEERKDDEVPWE